MPHLSALLLILLLTFSSSSSATTTAPDTQNEVTILSVLTDANIDPSYMTQFDSLGYDSPNLLRRMSKMDMVVMGLDPDEIIAFQNSIKKLVPDKKFINKNAAKVDVQLEARKALDYGRLYIDGSASAFQYMKATFGGSIPIKPHGLVYAPDEYGCNHSNNALGMFLVVSRGSCTYLEKATMAEASGALALIVVNTDNKVLFQVPAGHDLSPSTKESLPKIPVVLVSKNALNVIKEIDHIEPYTKSALIPLDCVGGECLPVHRLDLITLNKFDASGGSLFIDGRDDLGALDYVTSTFGGTIATGGEIVKSVPFDGCGGELKNGGAMKGKVVIIQRGTCSFTEKVMLAQRYGARMAIMVDDEELSVLDRIGATTDELDLIVMPVLMITKRSGEVISKFIADEGLDGEVYFTLTKDKAVVVPWEEIRNVLRNCRGANKRVDENSVEDCEENVKMLKGINARSIDRSNALKLFDIEEEEEEVEEEGGESEEGGTKKSEL